MNKEEQTPDLSTEKALSIADVCATYYCLHKLVIKTKPNDM